MTSCELDRELAETVLGRPFFNLDSFSFILKLLVVVNGRSYRFYSLTMFLRQLFALIMAETSVLGAAGTTHSQFSTAGNDCLSGLAVFFLSRKSNWRRRQFFDCVAHL